MVPFFVAFRETCHSARNLDISHAPEVPQITQKPSILGAVCVWVRGGRRKIRRNQRKGNALYGIYSSGIDMCSRIAHTINFFSQDPSVMGLVTNEPFCFYCFEIVGIVFYNQLF